MRRLVPVIAVAVLFACRDQSRVFLPPYELGARDALLYAQGIDPSSCNDCAEGSVSADSDETAIARASQHHWWWRELRGKPDFEPLLVIP
jgi:hypothetical protein